MKDIKSVLNERYQRIVVLCVMAQFSFVTIHTVILNFVHNQNFSTISTAHFFLSQLVLIFALAALLYLHLKNVSPEPLILVSHWNTVKFWISLKQLFQLLAFCGNGVLYSALLGMISYRNQFGDYEMVTLLCGATLGLKFHILYNSKHLYALKFEPVQQLKVPLLKSKIWSTLGYALVTALKHLLQFFPAFIFVFIIIHWIMPVEKLPFFELTPTTMVQRLLGQHLFDSLSIAFTFTASMLTMLVICQTILTEGHSFVLANLGQAMDDVNEPLVRYLAHKDFKQLALASPKRRSELFAISAPGGHPHTWNAVSMAAIKTLRQFTSLLNPPQEKKITEAKLSPQKYNLDRNINIRLLSSTNNNVTMATSVIKSSSQPLPLKKSDLFLSSLLSSSFFQYLRNESADLKLEDAYSKSQPIEWALDGLSAILVASYKEDKYGVVQWSLSSTLITMLELYITLERLHNRKSRNGSQNNEQGLKAATSSAIYRIVSKFQFHLSPSDFSEEHWVKLNRFRNFCE